MVSYIRTSFELFFKGCCGLVDARVAAENGCKVTLCDDLAWCRGPGRYAVGGKQLKHDTTVAQFYTLFGLWQGEHCRCGNALTPGSLRLSPGQCGVKCIGDDNDTDGTCGATTNN
jgi:hypothetical protein